MLYFTYSKQNEGSYETLRSAYRLPQMTNPYDEDGNLVYHCYRNDAVTNPLLESTKDGEHRENKRYRVFGNIHLQFKPVKGVTLRTQLSPQMLYTRNGIYIGTNAKNSVGHKATVTADYNQSQYWSYVWDNQATYETRIKKHYLNASIVQSIQMEQWETSDQEAKNLPFNSLWYNLDAANLSDVTKSGTDFQKRTLSSVLARVQYTYDDRYLLTVSGRYDGSSRLSKGNKWSFFPSAALGWRMMEEKFLRNVNWLSNLKLRLSYGVTGNDAVSIYGTQSGVEQLFYDFGGEVVSAYYKNGLANKNLTWEKTHEVNLGVDFGFLDSRINGSIDLYQRIAKDLIMKRNIPITSGWTSIWDNIGKVRNRGLEFTLNTVNIQHQYFKWETNLNFSTNHNEIEELYGAKKDDVSNKWFIGHPVDANYDYVFDGIWQTDEAEEAAKYGQNPGQVKVKDMDHNYIINSDDKRIIGHRSPSWIGSITNSFIYHNFDFSFYIYTQQGAKIQDAFMSSFMTYEGNYMQVNENYWTPEHPSNKYPRPGNKGKYFDAMRYCNVSFVRVGSITLGYSLPKNILDKIKVKNLRVYFTTNNPFTFTSYKGFDPEWAGQNTWGTATGYTTYLMGVKLEF
jgi:TonB-dependent starch-binding outer membrane protein SusC